MRIPQLRPVQGEPQVPAVDVGSGLAGNPSLLTKKERDLAAIGQSAGRIAGQAAAAYARAQEREAQLEGERAGNEAFLELDKLRNQKWLRRSGLDAKGLSQEAIQAAAKVKQKYEAKLSPTAKPYFQKKFLSVGFHFVDWSVGYEENQLRQAELKEYQATQQNELTAAMEDGQVGTHLLNFTEAVRKEHAGDPKEVVDQAIKTKTAEFARAYITNELNFPEGITQAEKLDKVQTAMGLLRGFEQRTGKALLRDVRGQLEKLRSTLKDSMFVENLYAKKGLADGLKAIDTSARTPEEKQKLKDLLLQKDTRVQQIRARVDAQGVQTVNDSLMPKLEDGALTMEEVDEVLSRVDLSPSKAAQLRDSYRQGIKKNTLQEQSEAYARLVSRSIDDPEGFLGLDLQEARPVIGEENYARLRARQETLRKGPRTQLEKLRDDARSLGIKVFNSQYRTGERAGATYWAEYGKFLRGLDQMLDTMDEKALADPQRTTAAVLSLLGEQKVSGGLFGLAPSRYRLYEGKQFTGEEEAKLSPMDASTRETMEELLGVPADAPFVKTEFGLNPSFSLKNRAFAQKFRMFHIQGPNLKKFLSARQLPASLTFPGKKEPLVFTDLWVDTTGKIRFYQGTLNGKKVLGEKR